MKKSIFLITGIFLGTMLSVAQFPGDVPEARHGHSMVTLPDGRVLLFGGEDVGGHLFNDLHTFDQVGWHEENPNGDIPPERADQAEWVRNQQMYIQGGRGEENLLSDMWRYDMENNEWEQVEQSGDIPSARYGHSVVTVDGKDYLYGGKDNSGSDLMDFYSFDPETSEWESDEEIHPPSAGHAIGVIGERIYAFGGIRWDENDFRDDARYYDTPLGSTWTYTYTSGDIPSALAFMCHTFAQFSNDKFMYMFGGENAEKEVTEKLYRFNMETEEWTELQGGPPATSNGAMALTWNGRQDTTLLLFGGKNSTGTPTNQVGVYDFTAGGWDMLTSVASAEEEVGEESVILFPNYPNPFKESTTISFRILKRTHTEINVYNTLGENINTLVRAMKVPGKHTVSWNGLDKKGKAMPSGVYFFRLKTDGQLIATKKCVLFRND